MINRTDIMNLEYNINKKPRKNIPKIIRDKVWDNNIGLQNGTGKCYCCNDQIDSKNFEAGHIVSVADGGETIIDNLRPICSKCNRSMGTDNMINFIQQYKIKPISSEENIEMNKTLKTLLKNKNIDNHTRQIKHHCNICNKYYKNNHSLNSHNSKYHNINKIINTINCLYCNREFNHYSNKSRHKKICKKNPENISPDNPIITLTETFKTLMSIVSNKQSSVNNIDNSKDKTTNNIVLNL